VSEVADIQQLMERAEGAAHRGDFPAAEEALRLAVELQERTLGASSPEVASTLNNLGIVYERLGRPADAEACYRKSFAIAKAVFGHDHPLVETSTTNLREFCDARGIRFEQTEPIAVVTAPVQAPRREPAEATTSSSRRPIVIAGVVLAGLIGIVMFASRRSADSVPHAQAPAATPTPVTVASQPSTPAPPPAPVTVAPQPSTPAPPPAPATASTAREVVAQAAAPVAIEVLDAQLCQSLDVEANWRCDRLPDSTTGGQVFFVTKLKAATDTSVEHRWYRNDKLTQAVTLKVRGTGSGYRTYSRSTTGPDRAGTWRVEIRGAGGAVLARKTFVVSVLPS
jgi:hypothetical protein